MPESIYPPSSQELARSRRELAPDIDSAFTAFSQRVFANGALPSKTKQLIAVAVAHVTQCPYCIKGHTKAAMRQGATKSELMEAIWVAAEMRAGGAYAHSSISLATMAEEEQRLGAKASTASARMDQPWDTGEATCEHCGAVHLYTYQDLPAETRGTQKCLRCGKELMRWKGGRDYFDFKLLNKGKAA
jgi:AhpD family alkylhydroperoxidase